MKSRWNAEKGAHSWKTRKMVDIHEAVAMNGGTSAESMVKLLQ